MRMPRRWIGVLLGLMAPTTVPGAPGDLWEVTQYSTNVRGGPGTDNRIITQTAKGDVVMELERREAWLRLRLLDGTEGWIRDDLMDRLTPDPESGNAPTPYFTVLRDMLLEADGVDGLFLNPTYLGYATVAVTATEHYLALPPETREHALDDLLRLWQTIDNTGIPASVILRLQDGRRLASKSALTGTHWFIDAGSL